MCCLLCVFQFASADAPQNPREMAVPEWLFPEPLPAKTKAVADSTQQLSVPGSEVKYTLAQINSPFVAPDWHPQSHAQMPNIVAYGRAPDIFACAFCHTPTGQGRPENSTLAGLPAAYIVEQLKAMRSGARNTAGPATYLPTHNMLASSAHLTDDDIQVAADYFSKQTLGSRVRVIEGTRIPKVIRSDWIYAKAPEGGEEDVGQRIIEIASDHSGHERRDDRMGYLAYVPAGSVQRGRELAAGATGLTQACASCHDLDLRGTDIGPPLAGRFPGYLLRQLVAFKRQARSGNRALMMQPVVANLGIDDLIAISAYAASLPP